MSFLSYNCQDPVKKFKQKFRHQPIIFDVGSHMVTMMASPDDTDALLG